MIISLIAAMDQNRVIGVNNQLPWQISEDLKYFRRVTSGNPVLMGRKTFESIGRVLPNRLNIIMTRRKDFQAPAGAWVVDSWERALATVRAQVPNAGELFVIGGAEIYQLALPYADRLYITEVDTQVKGGDAHFPNFNPGDYNEKKREVHPAVEETPRFSFVIYEKK
jgi:dihydrofolate reductase